MILIDVWEGGEAQARVQEYRERWGIEGTILLDESGDYAKSLGVTLPSSLLAGADAVIE